MKTTMHSNTTLAGTLSRAASHLRSSVARRTAPATPRSHSTLPAIRPAGLRAAFTATLAVLLLAVVPGKMAAQVIGWGDNSFGQTTVPAGAQSGVTAIGAGRFHTVALKSDGSVVAWGDNSSGQTTVPAGAQSGVTAIAVGFQHTVALKSDGSVVAWGENVHGATTVPAGAQSGVTAIAAGRFHTVALKSDGSVIAWGYNASGQTTVPAGAQSGVTAIASGSNHSVALKSDGSVVAWGDNSDGQTTVPAGALLGVTAIAAGSSHTVALKSDGSVLAWGSNSFGLTTVPAGAQSGVTAIAAGELHIVAIKSDGSVIAWGSNAGGQTTVPAGAQSGVTAIAAGEYHTVALKGGPVTTVIFMGATAGATPSPGDAVPGEPVGTTFVKLGVPAINGAGAAAFLTDIKAGTVTTKAVFAGTGIVARKGDAVGGFTLSAFKDPVFNDDNAVASLVTLTGAVTPATNKAILFVPDGGPAALIARLGGEPAGVAGAQWKSFKSVALPDGLGPVFTAQMVAGPGGVTTADDLGLWALDGSGVLRLIVRESVTVIDGKTVKSFVVLSAVSGVPGQTRAFNSAGELLYRVTFTDNSQAVVQTVMP